MNINFWYVLSIGILTACTVQATSTKDEQNERLSARFQQSLSIPRWNAQTPQFMWTVQGQMVMVADPQQQQLEEFESIAGEGNVIFQEDNTYLVRLDFSRVYPKESNVLFGRIEEAMSRCRDVSRGCSYQMWISMQENNLKNPVLDWLETLSNDEGIKKGLCYVDLRSNRITSLNGIPSLLKKYPNLQMGISMNPLDPSQLSNIDPGVLKRLVNRDWTYG